MISIILISLAAICNACMDKSTHHYGQSIFRKKNVRFWNPNVSHAYGKKILGWRYDAWHCFKSAMIVMLCFAIAFYEPIKLVNEANINDALNGVLFGLVWNVVFGIFYNRILKRK